jgi:hypothetical protein
MTWNTPYLGTPSGYSTTFSDISVSGTADLGILQTTGAVTHNTTVNTLGLQTFYVGATWNSGQGTLSVLSTSLQSVAAMTINDYESGQTTFTDNWAALGDTVIATPIDSDLSNGLAYNAYVSAASTVALRYSNVSGTEAKPIAQTWRFTLLRFI